MPSDSIDALPRTTSDLVALHGDSNHSCTWRRAPWINCSAIAMESVPHPVWVFSPVCSGVGFVPSRLRGSGSFCRMSPSYALSGSFCGALSSPLLVGTAPAWLPLGTVVCLGGDLAFLT